MILELSLHNLEGVIKSSAGILFYLVVPFLFEFEETKNWEISGLEKVVKIDSLKEWYLKMWKLCVKAQKMKAVELKRYGVPWHIKYKIVYIIYYNI